MAELAEVTAGRGGVRWAVTPSEPGAVTSVLQECQISFGMAQDQAGSEVIGGTGPLPPGAVIRLLKLGDTTTTGTISYAGEDLDGVHLYLGGSYGWSVTCPRRMTEVQSILDRLSVPHKRRQFQFRGRLFLPYEALTALLALRGPARRAPQALPREPAAPENDTPEL